MTVEQEVLNDSLNEDHRHKYNPLAYSNRAEEGNITEYGGFKGEIRIWWD